MSNATFDGLTRTWHSLMNPSADKEDASEQAPSQSTEDIVDNILARKNSGDFSEFDNMFNSFEGFLEVEQSLPGNNVFARNGKVKMSNFAYRLFKKDNTVVLKAMMPGAVKDTIHLTKQGHNLMLKYQYLELDTDALSPVKEMTIKLPDAEYAQAPSQIQAVYENGILAVTLQLIEPEQQSIAITFK